MTSVRMLAALATVYAAGYVTGALLVHPRDRASMSMNVIRTVSGLMFSGVALLLSLRLSAPWYAGPLVLFATAVVLHGRLAVAPPVLRFNFQWDGFAAAVLAALLLAPFPAAALRMAPGAFPPVFFHVDNAYFLETAHAVVQSDTFPPESLGVQGGHRPYHYGVQAITALVSRASLVAPHQVLFVIVVPLLVAGTAAAAVTLVRGIAPTMPLTIALPLLISTVPTLWYEHWAAVAPALRDTVASLSSGPLDSLTRRWEIWGVSAPPHNLAAQFVVLASLAAYVRAPAAGWRLLAFLAGSAFVFKSPAGVALLAGVTIAQLWCAGVTRRWKPLLPVAAMCAVFAVVYGALWVLIPVPAELHAVFSPMFLLDYLNAREAGLRWFLIDVLWLLLPALVVLLAGPRADPRSPVSIPLLLVALAPFAVLNTLRLVDVRRQLGGSSMNEDDWRQVIATAPLLIHAFVLSVVGTRWKELGTKLRAGVAAATVLVLSLPLTAAVRYTRVILMEPEKAHEFADNRAIGHALATIPVAGSVIVTNDLRYPADEFRRDNRQFQIPALFGHQAFAVNYQYEMYPFSPQRQELQKLLRDDRWTTGIETAAQTLGWTHLLIRNDYPHPAPIPLERTFDSGPYSVYRFSTHAR